MKPFIIAATLFGAFGVINGAFGAHALEDKLDPDMLEVWHTAVRYQMYHVVALFGTAWLTTEVSSSAVTVAGWSFIAGVLIFSGSLYLMALSGVKWLGAITPIGGVTMIVGWIALLIASLSLS